MSKILISTTETYRMDSEDEVAAFLEEVKKNSNYSLQSYSSKVKEIKAKGEVTDSWHQVQVRKIFNNEKEPDMGGISAGLGDE